jgi:hypothetical protein
MSLQTLYVHICILKLLSRPVICAPLNMPLNDLELNIYFYQFLINQVYSTLTTLHNSGSP